ncbi:MAG: hypothetical protein AB7L71_13280 [Vicinamibacterales bacterium]
MKRLTQMFMVTAAVTLILGGASTASAQSFGVRAGASGDPDQFYVGVHAETRPIADRVTFRPNVEVGFGDNVTALGANLEFVYRHELPNSSWTMLAGGGPAANFYSFDSRFGDDSDFGGGLNLLLGIEHSRGIFAEVKVGLIDSPSIKFGVGINLGR